MYDSEQLAKNQLSYSRKERLAYNLHHC